MQIFAPVPFKADCIEYILKAAEQPVCTLVAYEKWIQFPPKEWKEMQKANARLISTSPELLAALKEVVAISDRKHAAWDKAKAAIAKAEGKPTRTTDEAGMESCPVCRGVNRVNQEWSFECVNCGWKGNQDQKRSGNCPSCGHFGFYQLLPE